jgi:hypothetical protein
VPSTELAIAKHVGDLIYRARASRQHPFHVIFGGRLQPPIRRAHSNRDRIRGDAVDINISNTVLAKHGRLDFHHITLCKKAAHPGKLLRAAFKGRR